MTYLALIAHVAIIVVLAIAVADKVRSRRHYRSFSSWLAVLPLGTSGLKRVAGPVLVTGEAMVVLVGAASFWPSVASLNLERASLGCAATMLLVFGGVTGLLILQGTTATCHCFGAGSSSLGLEHVLRDIALALLAGVAACGATTRDVGDPAAAMCWTTGILLALLVARSDDLIDLIRPAAGAGSPYSTEGGSSWPRLL